MARTSKIVKLYQDIQQNPELRRINAEVSQINDLIAKMGRSSYFSDISLPEQINKITMVESAKTDYTATKSYLDSIKSSLNYAWQTRRNEESLESSIGIVSADGQFYKTLDFLPESALKRSERTGRGKLSEKATRILIANDIEILKRLTHKPETEIIDFLNKWYASPEVSGGQLLEKFVDGVYKAEYSGQGVSQSWGSPPVKQIIEEQIVNSFDIQVDYSDEIEKSWSTESKMGKELYDAWMNLFN